MNDLTVDMVCHTLLTLSTILWLCASERSSHIASRDIPASTPKYLVFLCNRLNDYQKGKMKVKVLVLQGILSFIEGRKMAPFLNYNDFSE